jgi:hypothetical protein
VIAEYAFHAESKSATADGTASTRQTIGLLQRRHCRIESVTGIGKESNRLEEVGAGLIHSAENVYNVYSDPSRDEWQRKVIPALKQARIADLARESGLSRRTIMNARKRSAQTSSAQSTNVGRCGAKAKIPYVKKIRSGRASRGMMRSVP